MGDVSWIVVFLSTGVGLIIGAVSMVGGKLDELENCPCGRNDFHVVCRNGSSGS